MSCVLQCPNCDDMFQWDDWPVEDRIILPPLHITCPDCRHPLDVDYLHDTSSEW